MFFNVSNRISPQMTWVLPAFCWIWAGMILGVSFIATPVKFHALGITMPIALAVGKVTFHLFNTLEWCMFLCVFTLQIFSGSTRKKLLIITAIFLVLAMQTWWLMPALDSRIDLITAGKSEPLSSGYIHWFYVIAECSKVLLILIYAKINIKE